MRLQVEPGGGVADPLDGDGVDVALAHHDVQLSGDLDLGLVLGLEEHLVAGLDRAGVRADGDHRGPDEPPGAHRGRRRDHDAARRAALAGLLVDLDQDAVVEHLDGGLVTHGQPTPLRTTTKKPTTPTTIPTVLRMLSVRGWPVCAST